jgi:hypothetical protein
MREQNGPNNSPHTSKNTVQPLPNENAQPSQFFPPARKFIIYDSLFLRKITLIHIKLT